MEGAAGDLCNVDRALHLARLSVDLPLQHGTFNTARSRWPDKSCWSHGRLSMIEQWLCREGGGRTSS